MNRRFIVMVLTHDPLGTSRFGLLEATLKSIKWAFPDQNVIIVNNGEGMPGTDEYVDQLAHDYQGNCMVFHVCDHDNCTPGKGRNASMDMLCSIADGDPIVVFSDDDMDWGIGAGEILDKFWSAEDKPKELALLCGYLEPEYAHNTPRGLVVSNEVRAVVRDSAPGCAWSFPLSHWKTSIGPVIDDFGYDTNACCKLREMGLSVAQIDLAQHTGKGASTHGNDMRIWTRPFDKEKWGI